MSKTINVKKKLIKQFITINLKEKINIKETEEIKNVSRIVN